MPGEQLKIKVKLKIMISTYQHLTK